MRGSARKSAIAAEVHRTARTTLRMEWVTSMVVTLQKGHAVVVVAHRPTTSSSPQRLFHSGATLGNRASGTPGEIGIPHEKAAHRRSPHRKFSCVRVERVCGRNHRRRTGWPQANTDQVQAELSRPGGWKLSGSGGPCKVGMCVLGPQRRVPRRATRRRSRQRWLWSHTELGPNSEGRP
jgi:hypothetical protein